MPRNGIAESYDNFMFNIMMNHQTISTVAVVVYIPTNALVFQFLCSLIKTYFPFLNYSYPIAYEVPSHCGLGLFSQHCFLKLHIHLPYHLAIAILCIYPKELKAFVHTKTCL